jgi:predicted HicB family RNase H-like nuclease
VAKRDLDFQPFYNRRVIGAEAPSLKQPSGKFMARVSPKTYRLLTIKAAESGLSVRLKCKG